MGDLKSLASLWCDLASNQRYYSYVDKSDLDTFNRRVTNEGLSFLTRVLPKLGKALDRYHSTREWQPPEEFETTGMLYREEGDPDTPILGVVQIPIFLYEAVYRALVGDPVAVDCVRQLTYLFYKLEVGYEESVIKEFIEKFKRTDRDLPDFLDSSNHFVDILLQRMKRLIQRVLCNADPLDIVPSHGGGATACRTANWDKYHRLRYFPKLDDVFPYSDYFFFNFTHLSDEMGLLEEATISAPQARVCLVPKDSRGPRVISCEPAELMFIQQGLMRKLYETIESHTLTRGRINFIDQTINRSLAQSASINNDLATIDLSDASDRVSLALVRRVFPSNWVEALEACRSETTLLDGREVVKLNKFAPMGSACCFPVEALVFWACAEATRQIYFARSKRDIFVYGDDIILSSNIAEEVIRSLEAIGLLVNRDKCYVEGPFRESCGGDFYLGVDVTPVRYRKTLGLSGTLLDTSADFINLLIEKFGEAEVGDIISNIQDDIGYVFPRSELALPGTIRSSPCASNDVFFRRRWNNSLQRFEHRILKAGCKVIQRRPPNWGELFRKQLSLRVVKKLDRYSNQVAILDAKCDPGEYTDPHSFRTKWAWCWLG